MIQLSSFNFKKARWDRIKSKGKKRYVLKTLFIYSVLLMFSAIVFMFVIDGEELTTNPQTIFSYLLSILILSPVGIWVGINSWNANMRRFER